MRPLELKVCIIKIDMVVYRDHNQIKIYLVFAKENVKAMHALDTFCKDQRNKRVVVATDTSYGSCYCVLYEILLL